MRQEYSCVSDVYTLLFMLRYSMESTDIDQKPICISFPKLQNSWGRKPSFLMNCTYLAASIFPLQ